MSVRCVSVGAPENLGFLGRAEALVARRFSGAVSAMRLKCRMRVQNYCKNLDKKKVKCTKSEKNAINVEKNQRSCIFTNIFVGIFVNALQTLQTLHIFESQARVRI